MPNALLVYPKHPPSYWGANFALDIVGIKSAFSPQYSHRNTTSVLWI